MNSPHIIAHRGDSRNAPENTMAAFRSAIKCGADGVEFDVQLAADGVPVVVHDYDLQRTAGRREKIGELTSKQLAQVDVGKWFGEKFAGETVPTLLSILEMYSNSGGPIFIELKCESGDYSDLVTNVCDLIRESPLMPRVIVKSFRLAAIGEVRFRLPDVQTAALFEPSIMTILRRRQYIIAMAREFGAHQISLHTSLATAKLAELAKQSGMPTTVWTADSSRWIARCRERNIDNLITNDPGKMLAARR
ncbi:MAG TPA: glycerophosphodiester phosphodiesterase family protein [Pyrinomonadaceae bacterium]|nr:glycerophosphodiester phosphodiesterase family protein [Pyrinomonadaceae bacterium]